MKPCIALCIASGLFALMMLVSYIDTKSAGALSSSIIASCISAVFLALAAAFWARKNLLSEYIERSEE